jgi:nucleoporin NUP82
LSRFATAFAFGSSPGWGELMVYCLMANGDLYALGPILPLRTEVPVQWLQRLKAVSDARRRGVLATDQGEEERVSMQSQWVEALVRQATVRREEATPPTPPRRTSILSGRPRTEVETKQPEWEGTVKLHPPHLTASGGPAPGIHRSLLRQGPVVFLPAPSGKEDEEDDDDDVASDLLVWSPRGEDEEEVGVGVMAIAWSSGRVDLGLETEPVEPRWVGSRVSAATDLADMVGSIDNGDHSSPHRIRCSRELGSRRRYWAVSCARRSAPRRFLCPARTGSRLHLGLTMDHGAARGPGRPASQ